MSYSLQIVSIVVFLLLFIGCGSDDPARPDDGEGRVVMYLADAPADVFTEVNVELESVEIYSEQNGWVEVRSEAAIYNLLELTNGTMAVVVDMNVEADTYTLIRVHIGGESNIVVDGSMVDVSLSSGFQGGVELDHHIEIQSGATAEILLDFDAHHSVSGSLTGGFTLEPVIRVQSMDDAGDISGEVVPLDARAVVIASAEGEVVTSTYVEEQSGEFKLVGLVRGNYDLEIVARNGNYETEIKSDVNVEAGQTTNVGLIALESDDHEDIESY